MQQNAEVLLTSLHRRHFAVTNRLDQKAIGPSFALCLGRESVFQSLRYDSVRCFVVSSGIECIFQRHYGCKILRDWWDLSYPATELRCRKKKERWHKWDGRDLGSLFAMMVCHLRTHSIGLATILLKNSDCLSSLLIGASTDCTSCFALSFSRSILPNSWIALSFPLLVWKERSKDMYIYKVVLTLGSLSLR